MYIYIKCTYYNIFNNLIKCNGTSDISAKIPTTNFIPYIISLINQFIPLLTNKISSNILSKNWITNKIKRDINKKYKLYKIYLDSKEKIYR